MTAQRGASRAAAIGRGLASLAALIILLAGIPATLYLVAGSPIPHGVPAWPQITTTLSQPDNGTLFLGAVRLVSWLGWAAFAIAVATEVVAQMRGRRARRLPGLGGMQRLAGRLLTSAAVAFASGAPAAFAAVPPAAPAAVTATLTGENGHIQVVKPGDTLSQIAQDDLGNWRLYPEIFHDSQHLTQPHGHPLTSPDLIFPGQHLLIPGTTPPLDHPSAQPASFAGNATAPPAPPAAGTPRPAQPPAAGSGALPRAGDAGYAPQAAAHSEHGGIPVATIAGYGALLASVTLNILTLKRRIQQRRRTPGRRIRMPATMSDTERGIRAAAEPGSVALLDRALRSLAARSSGVDAVLPAITGALVTGWGVELLLAGPAEPLAPFAAADDSAWRLDTGSAALLDPAAAKDVPAPYPALVTLGDDAAGTHVLVDLVEIGAITLHGDQEHVREVLSAIALEMAASPWADFIVVNCAGFGADLPRLIGTGRLRHAADAGQILAGMQAHAREVTTTLAESGVDSVRAARSRRVAGDAWTPQIILSATPLTDEQLAVIGELVSADPDLVNLAAVVAAAGDEPALPGPWQLDVTLGRTIKLPVLDREITLQRVTAGQYRQLTADLSAADDVSGVAAADSPDDVDGPGGETTGRSDEQEKEAGPQVMTEASPEPGELGIRVLGAVEITGRDRADIESGKRNLLPELAAYLRLYPGRSAEEVSRAMGGPRGPWAAATRASNMSRLRAWLGRDPSGRNYVPALGEGRLYTLLDSVRCDWDEFRRLAKRGLAPGPAQDGVADLRAALQLVRGQPLAGAGPHNYIWAEFIKQEMISAIVDVAHALGVKLAQTGDAAGARAAAVRGLEVEPGSELLYRDLFRAEHRAGNAAGIEEAAERLMVTLAELDLDMEPETAELLNQLRGRRRVTARTGP